MIPKQEILSIAETTGLPPTTVEKDYVLSWVLYGISKNTHLAQWVFKGGTCLKKCYFDTYRFSEDLDFTVPKGALYHQGGIVTALKEIAAIVYDETGIRIEQEEAKESFNKKGSKTFEAKVSYVGPLNFERARSNPRIKFDITDDEILVEEPDHREVFHPYRDAPNPRTRIFCYSIHEILAEKTRAMFERAGRARDLYDVIHITRNFREHIQIEKARACLEKKFTFKSLPEPSVQLLMENIDLALLKANWEGQLKHQLSRLIAVEHYYNALPIELDWWINATPVIDSLPMISNAVNENVLPRDYFPTIGERPVQSLGRGRPTNLRSVSINSAGHLYQVRYAARNRLCILLRYKNITRKVEPYSLRKPSTGNVLLYAYELIRDGMPSQQIKAFKVHQIMSIEITKDIFDPRYVVEL